MSTLEATVSMLEGLSDEQLLHVQDFVKRFLYYPKAENPHRPLSKEEILKKLDLSKQHADMGMVKNAEDVIEDLGKKYGL